ncbi:Myb-like_DNA-binding domain-containing protein [Hexamita inflata]|uniref:Myb-like DNA-binding domain-containing protein n=1 Tax=Hexamita inflata TaxID=28002 RepID=A0AA86QFS0_9EUKA|nr:Myb-like DNA-binding domain-containing protein [Hexamita inflata]
MTYHNWTKQEINRLSKAVKKHGLNWAIIQKTYFPEFNVISVKNKYYAMAHEIMARRQEKESGLLSGSDQEIQQQMKQNVLSEEDVLDKIKQILTQKVQQ